MMKQAKANQLRANLLQKQQAISIDELKMKGPKFIMNSIQYCVSDDEYDTYEEKLNFRYAKLMLMDEQVKSSKNFLSVQNEANRFTLENPRDYFNRQQGSKPRSNTPRRKSNLENKQESQKEQSGNTQLNERSQNQRRSTIKKSQTQEESTPKNDHEKTSQNVKNLRNTLHTYIENSNNEQNKQIQNNTISYKVRSSSYEETTCLFQYLTNLNQTFRRADKFKKEANFEIFDCLEVIKHVMVQYSEQMPHQIVSNNYNYFTLLIKECQFKNVQFLRCINKSLTSQKSQQFNDHIKISNKQFQFKKQEYEIQKFYLLPEKQKYR